MRKLTITRRKTFVASLGKMKVYIEDPMDGEIYISGVYCRQLGTLKNGEVASFEIGEGAAKVFVIADKMSKNYCNDYFPIPEGDFDVYLSGINRLDPIVGNAFRFDGTPTEEVIANRKKATKKGVPIFVVSLVVGIILGVVLSTSLLSGIFEPDPQTFSVEGFSITLTDEFEEFDEEYFDAAYSTDEVAVLVLNEKYSVYPELRSISAKEYAELFIEIHELTAKVKQNGGLTFVEYSAKGSDGETYRFVSYIYKGDKSFYLVQFGVLAENYADYSELISEWAKTVEY